MSESSLVWQTEVPVSYFVIRYLVHFYTLYDFKNPFKKIITGFRVIHNVGMLGSGK
jgi:hypothetical protein